MSDRKPPVSVALDPAQWNVVVQALGEAPWKLADPIIQAVVVAMKAPQQEAKVQTLGAVTGAPLVSPPPQTAFDKLKEQIR